MKAMQTRDIQLFKQRLLDKKISLLQEIKKTMGSNRETGARLSFELVQDNPDRSVDELLKHVSSHVLGSKAIELEVIASALLRIRENTYGECDVCGEDISFERLQVYPEAECCVACQNQREHMDSVAPDQNPRPKPPGTEEYLDDEE
jgi:DnaK suppressor protein